MGQLVPAGGTTPSAAGIKREGLSRSATALNALLPDDRGLILLRQIEDLPFADIANRMGGWKACRSCGSAGWKPSARRSTPVFRRRLRNKSVRAADLTHGLQLDGSMLCLWVVS